MTTIGMAQPVRTPAEYAQGRGDGVPSYFSLGFMRPGPDVRFGSSQRALGAPGAGGSFAFADPDARLGYAYVMNKMDFYLVDDPREKPLRDAVYRAIERHTSISRRRAATSNTGKTSPRDTNRRSPPDLQRT